MDLTSKFLGRTVHAEYDGYLRASSEQNIYDPWSGVRLHFEDCNEGFVCIRTRWREDDISGSGNNPDSRYLQVRLYLKLNVRK